MYKNFFIYTFTTVILLMFLIQGCLDKPKRELVFGSNMWIGYQPIYLAKDFNLINEYDLKLIEYPSTTEVKRAFENGIIDIAGVTIDEAISMAQKGIKFKIFLVADISNGADALLSNNDSIKQLSDLKMKKIGVENTALGAFFLSRILEFADLKISDINLVSLELSEHKRAFLDKKVDALITFEPMKSYLLSAGAKVLLDSRAIKDEIVDVLIVRDDIYFQRFNEIEKLSKNWFKVVDLIKNKDEEILSRLSQRLEFTSEELKNSLLGINYANYKKNREFLYSKKPKLLKTLDRISDFMLKNRLIEKRVDLNDMFIKD